jgi:HD-GYP domain-containing protein (c-di-GMP phosphodiesterase class II)
MKRLLNLTGRTFLIVSVSIGMLLGIAMAAGVLRTSLGQAVVAALILSAGITRAVTHLRRSAWSDLLHGVLESERTGELPSNLPLTSPLPEVNRVAEAMNGAARSVLASQAALEGAYLQFVETMAEALDARDPYTAGHSLRVGSYSHALALAMGLSEEEAETIRIAAQLHDIGKIGIPDAVLQKPGRLTPEEYGLIKLHPQIGRKILEKVGRFDRLLSVVELHHENHDGTGYPYGLTGDNVPVAARIVHVADSFDAMTTTRSYRRALSVLAASLELEKNAGGQFDPVATRTFLRLIAEGRIEAGGLEVSRESPIEAETRALIPV